MPYAILPSDPTVEAALRRVAQEEAEDALARVTADGPLGPRVHAMRKSVKKIRGLLRLVRRALPEAAAENAALRDAGRGLSDLRDAAVQRATLERLAERMAEDRREALLAPFRAAEAEADAEAADALLPAFAAAMEGVRERAEGWSLRRDGWDALEPGLVATWSAAKAARRAAWRDPARDNVHEWRKRAKDHWYQARLLAPIWPEAMAPHVAAADELGEVLGLAGDLAVLQERLAAAPLDPRLAEEAEALARRREAELLVRAHPLARRLLAGPAEAAARRWGAWWRRRGEVQEAVAEAEAAAEAASEAGDRSASSISEAVSATP